MKCYILLVVFVSISATARGDYTAGVVEYASLSEATPTATIEKNLEEYIHYIESARNNGVQIIVFPEYGLTGIVTEPADYAIDVPNVKSGTTFTDYRLQKLSNAAREHSMYIVVNLLEKASSENNDAIYYNTNIVFDRTGEIIAKYRKINLYTEPNLTAGNETVTFTTDFGVTFGLLTSADILFYHPSKTIYSTGSITDIVFPTAMLSTIPFFHSLSLQSGYSQANRVNFLAASFNDPSHSLGGSGIYRHDGTIDTYYISGVTSSKLLVSTLQPRGVPRNIDGGFTTFGFDILNTSKSDTLSYHTPRDFRYDNYAIKQLEVTASGVEETLCQGAFCCSFAVTAVTTTVGEFYQLVVYNGPAMIGAVNRNIRLCTVVSCESQDVSTCGSRNMSLITRFSKIGITGNFESEPDHFYQPVTLTTLLLPVFNTSFSSETIDNTTSVTISSTRNIENLIAFGILGRGHGGAPVFGSSVVFLVLMSVLRYMFYEVKNMTQF
ncbi:hypothetical protein NQ315_009250 [Exocentrus adspersus]|uniref:CN hydrolase domain-containing protein n=1 Tax=Exocentrus adspersus TaxID=1586481 RepID=A0AAV8WFR7_9CUCU|nr:hypothetical protein NQ315_009250 [Exocentrus adspersus]